MRANKLFRRNGWKKLTAEKEREVLYAFEKGIPRRKVTRGHDILEGPLFRIIRKTAGKICLNSILW